MKIRRPAHSVIVAYLALVLALSGTGYAAVKIDGRTLKNGSVTGKKLRPDTVTGKQVAEASLGKVGAAASADHADQADQSDHASTADNAVNATNANTLGSLEPNAFARSSQFQVAGPFTTNPSGPENEFFSFPEMDLRIVTPRAPNAPGTAGLIEVQHENPDVPLLWHLNYAYGQSGGQFSTTSSGINFIVDGPNSFDDYLEMTFHSPTTGRTVRIECVADVLTTDIPVTCSALSYTP